MKRFLTKHPLPQGRRISTQAAESLIRAQLTDFDDAADTLRVKAALKRAVAKCDAPAYLIDAIRREIRR